MAHSSSHPFGGHNTQPRFKPCGCCCKQFFFFLFFKDELSNILLDCVLFQGRLQSPDSGKHLHDVLDLLQKHTLVEADISAQAERIKAVQGAAQRFTSYEQGEF